MLCADRRPVASYPRATPHRSMEVSRAWREEPVVADRVMFVQLKTGHDIDRGPCWISVVRFNRSWQTAYWHGKTLRRIPSLFDANFCDIDTGDEYWLSGPHRDRRDTRYGNVVPVIDDDARQAYQAFLDGAPLPGRERG